MHDDIEELRRRLLAGDPGATRAAVGLVFGETDPVAARIVDLLRAGGLEPSRLMAFALMRIAAAFVTTDTSPLSREAFLQMVGLVYDVYAKAARTLSITCPKCNRTSCGAVQEAARPSMPGTFTTRGEEPREALGAALAEWGDD